MRIWYESTDREFATNVVNRLVDLVGKTFTDLSVSRIRETESYLSRQLELAESEYTRLQGNLVAFQDKYGVYDITQQTSANIQALASLQSQLLNLKINLESQSKMYPETDYRIVQLKDQINGTQNAIDALTEGSGKVGSGILPQKQLLSLSIQYQGRHRPAGHREHRQVPVRGCKDGRVDDVAGLPGGRVRRGAGAAFRSATELYRDRRDLRRGLRERPARVHPRVLRARAA
jgi:hypothetical protein